MEFGANINSKDYNGQKSLHIANREYHIKAAVTLLENGPDIKISYLGGLGEIPITETSSEILSTFCLTKPEIRVRVY